MEEKHKGNPLSTKNQD